MNTLDFGLKNCLKATHTERLWSRLRCTGVQIATSLKERRSVIQSGPFNLPWSRHLSCHSLPYYSVSYHDAINVVRLFKPLWKVLVFAVWTRVIGSILFELMEEIKCWKCLLLRSVTNILLSWPMLAGPKFWAFLAQHNFLLHTIHEIEGATQNLILGMCVKFYGYMYRGRNACRVKRSLLNFCTHAN